MTWLEATAFFLPFAVLWNFLRRRKPPNWTTNTTAAPLPISLGLTGYGKALVAWLFLFARTFTLRPGIYYLGKCDPQAPLVVTGNFYLTLFVLARQLRHKTVRLLVIDTGGINVWCSASKGVFTAAEIIAKARECGLLQPDQELRVILPKLSLAGVKLAELRAAGIRPVVGPLYADELDRCLGEGKLRNHMGDVVRFGFKERLYSAVPTAVQFLYTFLAIYVLALGRLQMGFVWTAAILAFCYPLLFPYLPGKWFAVKGLCLGTAVAILAGLYWASAGTLEAGVLYKLLFPLPTAIFVGLSYTGNSPISNYTAVRREIASFLPVVILLYGLVLVLKIVF